MDEGNGCEQWRPVCGFEGLYEVSDQGRVRSLDRSITDRRGRRQLIAGRIKSLPKLNTGYPVVHLAKDGRTITKAVHTVVLEAFVGPRPAGHVCCHNDGDPSNNWLANLRWDTQSNNLLDAIKHGTHSRFPAPRNERRPCEVVPLEGESWNPVVGFERFEVSDQGRVRSSDDRMLSPRVSTGGYLVVTFNVNGRKETRRIHRLVLEAFVGPAPLGTFGCHVDGDPANNRLSNLRWDTQANNLRDVVSHGRHHCSNRTQCLRGHEFTPENTILNAKGHRKCRQCEAIRRAKRRVTHGDRIREQKRAAWKRQVEAEGRVYTPKGPRERRGTRTHCAYGHERTPENTIYDATGRRRCAVCRREQALARYRQKREAQGQRYFPGGVRTHCYNGHELTPENTVYEGRNRVRRCKTCREQYQVQHGQIRTHCENGHPLTAENTEIEGRRRRCKICSQQPGTQLELPLRDVKTHCKKGHPFTAENTLKSIDGKRRCRRCRDDRLRARYETDRKAINARHRQLYKKKREAQGKTYNPDRIKTHCAHGHELTPENIYFDKNGRRAGCKACRSARTRAHYYANIDAAKQYRRDYYRRRREAEGKKADSALPHRSGIDQHPVITA